MSAKHSIVKVFLLGLVLLMNPISIIAQPFNNNCQNATWLSDVREYCSPVAAFSNQYEQSPISTNINCPTNESAMWFRFRAVATDLSVTVIGNIRGSAGGTLRQPEISLSIERDCESNSYSIIELSLIHI